MGGEGPTLDTPAKIEIVAKSITNRQREILTAIIESYISTGEPISSGTLALKSDGDVDQLRDRTSVV